MDLDETSQTSEESTRPYQVTEEIWMVPCVIDHKTSTFTPISHPSSPASFDSSLPKQVWSPSEDEMLRILIAHKGIKAWTAVARELNLRVHNGDSVRHGKHCRERWMNHLNPDLRKGGWSPAEDLVLLRQQRELGNRWSDIAKLLPGRNENSVKNRWKSMVRKAEKTCPPGSDIVESLISEKQTQDSPFLSQGLTPTTTASPPPMAFYPITLPPLLEPHTQAVTDVRRTLMSIESLPWPQFNPTQGFYRM